MNTLHIVVVPALDDGGEPYLGLQLLVDGKACWNSRAKPRPRWRRPRAHLIWPGPTDGCLQHPVCAKAWAGRPKSTIRRSLCWTAVAARCGATSKRFVWFRRYHLEPRQLPKDAKPSRTAPRPTARPSASSRPVCANGPTAGSGPTAPNELPGCPHSWPIQRPLTTLSPRLQTSSLSPLREHPVETQQLAAVHPPWPAPL